MRYLIFFSIIFLLNCSEAEEISIETHNETILNAPEVFPEYPGGATELKLFIKENLKYPKQCLEGRVFVMVVVEKDGEITNEEVVKGITDEADNEALRVVKLLPDFMPGKFMGKNVRIRMIIPIHFRLN